VFFLNTVYIVHAFAFLKMFTVNVSYSLHGLPRGGRGVPKICKGRRDSSMTARRSTKWKIKCTPPPWLLSGRCQDTRLDAGMLLQTLGHVNL